MPGSFFENLIKHLPKNPQARLCLVIGAAGCAGLTLTVFLIVITPSLSEDQITFTSQPIDCCTVHVTGGVAHPGIYKLPDGKRIYDLIEEAGGLGTDVDLVGIEKLDMLQVLEDGQKVEVPALESTSSMIAPTPSINTDSDSLSVNTASLDELIELPYIGDKKAAAIVQQRPYVTMDDFFQKNRFSATQRIELEVLLKI